MSCKDLAKKIFSDDYEIKEVMDLGDVCLVDFKRKNVEANVDCQEGCEVRCSESYNIGEEEWEECYKECLSECEETKNMAEIGSVAFDKQTLSIKELTLPVNCENYFWYTHYETEERRKAEEKMKKLLGKLRGKGCVTNEAWVHAHEIIGLGEIEEEAPAICYLHLKGKPGKCRIDEVLKEIEKHEK